MDLEKMAHELSILYAKSELSKCDSDAPQDKLNILLESYCTAYGFFTSRNLEYLQELSQRGDL